MRQRVGGGDGARARRPQQRDEQQPDGAAAEDADDVAGSDQPEIEGMERHRGRLDECRLLVGHGIGHVDEVALGPGEELAQATVVAPVTGEPLADAEVGVACAAWPTR
jgi:hypothetical protein